MSWFSGTLVFLVIWWLVLFVVLPWGNRPVENPEPGHATSAPETPRIALKFAITTGITLVIFAIIYAVSEAGLINFRDIPE